MASAGLTSLFYLVVLSMETAMFTNSGHPGELLESPREGGGADPPPAPAPACPEAAASPTGAFLVILEGEGVHALVLHHALLGDGELRRVVVRVVSALAVAAAALRWPVQADRIG